MLTFESPFAAALNRLLQSEHWARERLLPFAAETLELRAAALPPLRFTITAEGTLGAAAPGAVPSLVVSAGPEALAAALRGEDQLLRAVDIAGNARLAAEVMFLARHLRPDVEEGLAKVVGDVAAHRLAGMARNAAAWHADAVRRVAGSLVEYAVEEKQLVVARAELRGIAAAHAQLRDGLARLEQRVDKLAEGR